MRLIIFILMNKTNTTSYSGVSGIYFDKIIREIISLGELNLTNKKILDFGCGVKRLENKLKKKIYNYDINPIFNEFNNLNSINFDIVVMNHVLMYLSKHDIEVYLINFYRKTQIVNF